MRDSKSAKRYGERDGASAIEIVGTRNAPARQDLRAIVCYKKNRNRVTSSLIADKATDLRANVEGNKGIFVVRGADTTRGWNGIRYKTGLSAKNVGAKELSMDVRRFRQGVPPMNTLHVDCEVMLYLYGEKWSLRRGYLHPDEE